MNIQSIPQIKNTESGNFFVLAGPCAIEGEEMAMKIAEKLVLITDKLEIPFVFKGSFKKANRSRIDSFSGIGDEKALKILRKVSETFHIPTVTDIHTNEDADKAAFGPCAALQLRPLASPFAPSRSRRRPAKLRTAPCRDCWQFSVRACFAYVFGL
jgi:3-deoxy-D-manno-octulosonic acid (KDO) 8-phosphate synthase